jgi:hypothetical protein
MPARVFLTPTSFGNVQNTFGRTESFGTARHCITERRGCRNGGGQHLSPPSVPSSG